MAVMDEFREERELMKNRSFKAKLMYFWDYYKWHTFAVIVAICVIISILHAFLSQKTPVYNLLVINGVETNQLEYLLEDLNEKYEVNPKKEEVHVETSISIDESKYDQNTTQNVQRVQIYISAGDVDAIASDSKMFNKYAYLDVFADLRNVVSKDFLEKYKGFIFYADRAVIQKQAEQYANLDYETPIDYPDPFHPEKMEDPIPVGICLYEMGCKNDLFVIADKKPIVGLVVNGEHSDKSAAFMDALDSFKIVGDVYVPGLSY